MVHIILSNYHPLISHAFTSTAQARHTGWEVNKSFHYNSNTCMFRQSRETSFVAGFLTNPRSSICLPFQHPVRSVLRKKSRQNSFQSYCRALYCPPQHTRHVRFADLPTDDSDASPPMPPTPRLPCIPLEPLPEEGSQCPYEPSPLTNRRHSFPPSSQSSYYTMNTSRGRLAYHQAVDFNASPSMPPTPKLPHDILPPSPVRTLNYPAETDSKFTMELNSGGHGWVVSAVMGNSTLDLLLGISYQLEIDHSYGLNKPITELTLRISTSDEQAFRANYRQLCNVVYQVIQHYSKHLTAITICLPRDCPMGLSPTSYNLRSTVDLGALRQFVWAGPLDLLPNSLKCLPFKAVERLSLSRCRISTPDCLEILCYAPRVKELKLEELADVPSIFDHRRRGGVVLDQLTSLTLASNIDHDAFLAAIRMEELRTAYLSSSSYHAIKLPSSIPLGKMTLLTVDAPSVDVGFVDSVMTRLDDRSEGTRQFSVIINNRCIVKRGRRPSMAPSFR